MKKLFPKEIILETTNYCNLKCRFCHFHGLSSTPVRPKGYMKETLWQKILDELSDIQHPIILCLHGAGEPLLYPKLKKLIKQAKTNPMLQVGFMTNGMLLTPEWSDFLLEEGIDWLAFSVDGVKPETNNFFRRGASLKTVEKNIFYLINTKQKKGLNTPHLSFNMVAYPEIKNQEQEYVKKWLPYASSVSISNFRPIGSKTLFIKDNALPPKPCPLLYKQLVISWDGKAGLCCEDIFLDVKVGDANLDTLANIFNNNILSHYRIEHEKHNLNTLKLCKECDVWASDHTLNKREFSIDCYKVRCQETFSGRIYTLKT